MYFYKEVLNVNDENEISQGIQLAWGSYFNDLRIPIVTEAIKCFIAFQRHFKITMMAKNSQLVKRLNFFHSEEATILREFNVYFLWLEQDSSYNY